MNSLRSAAESAAKAAWARASTAARVGTGGASVTGPFGGGAGAGVWSRQRSAASTRRGCHAAEKKGGAAALATAPLGGKDRRRFRGGGPRAPASLLLCLIPKRAFPAREVNCWPCCGRHVPRLPHVARHTVSRVVAGPLTAPRKPHPFRTNELYPGPRVRAGIFEIDSSSRRACRHGPRRLDQGAAPKRRSHHGAAPDAPEPGPRLRRRRRRPVVVRSSATSSGAALSAASWRARQPS